MFKLADYSRLGKENAFGKIQKGFYLRFTVERPLSHDQNIFEGNSSKDIIEIIVMVSLNSLAFCIFFLIQKPTGAT